MQIYEVFHEGILKGMTTVPAVKPEAPVKYQPVRKSIVNRMSQALGGGSIYRDPFERPQAELEPVTEPAKDTVDYDIPAYARKGITKPADTKPAVAPPETAEPSPAKSAVGVKQINQLIPKIRSRDLNSIKKNIDSVLTKRQSRTAEPSAMSSMASQLTSKPIKTSTGGSLQQTPTGSIHTAKPVAKKPAPAKKTPAKKPAWSGRKQKISAPPPSGAPTPDEYANFEKKVQQAMAAQGQAK